MRTPSGRVRRRQVYVRPGANLEDLAARVSYVGSAEHKSSPSPAGSPRLRRDATKCDPALSGAFDTLTAWLREGVRAGNVGSPWQGELPRYVWIKQSGKWYEAYLV